MEFEIVSSPNAPRSVGAYSQGIRAGQFVFCSGQGGFDPARGKLVEGGIREQTRQVLRNLESVLEAAGSSLSRVVKVTVLLHDWKYFKEMNEVFAEFFGEKPPARSTVQGARWPEGSLVAMDAIAVTEKEE
jgi:2-iminobutanoate/2-iminopropanoate deaminase